MSIVYNSLLMKRLFTNLLLAYVLFTSIILIRNYIQIEIIKDNTFFSGPFLEYVTGNILMIFFIIPSVFALLVLLPYNLIMVYSNTKKIAYKILIFESIIIVMFCLAGTFINVWSYPYWTNLKYLLYFLPLSIVFSSIIHVTLDNKSKD